MSEEKNVVNKFFGWFMVIVILLVFSGVALWAFDLMFSIVYSIIVWVLPFVGLFFVGYVGYYVFLKEKK